MGLTLEQLTALCSDGARHSLRKSLTASICDFEHQETDIFRVRHFLKSNCLIFLGIGCLIGVFLKGNRG